jgi:hypothetical protein
MADNDGGDRWYVGKLIGALKPPTLLFLALITIMNLGMVYYAISSRREMDDKVMNRLLSDLAACYDKKN